MDYSLPGSSVHGILQARTLERVVMPSSREIFPTQGLNLGYISKFQIPNGNFFVSGVGKSGYIGEYTLFLFF